MENKNENEKESSNNLFIDPLIGKVFFSKYKIIKKLGEGSFGKVYQAKYNEDDFAVKIEDKSRNVVLLEGEATIMNYLRGPNIPYIKSYGYSGDYNVLVMQLLCRSLDDIFNKLSKFSIKTTAMLGYQMIKVLQYIHDRHIIHRDIKPDNFAMGDKENNSNLYLLDFGLAKKYRSSRTLIHNPYIKKKKLTGTARYASIHALEAYEQSRRDDLESVGYVLMYFLRGSLPWQGLKIKNKEERYNKILEIKKEISSEELCKNFPKQFFEFVEYSKTLEYEEEPNYDMLKKKFLSLLNDSKSTFDYIYDWTTEEDLKYRKEGKKIQIKGKNNDENEDNINDKYLTTETFLINKKGGEKLRNKENERIESVCCLM